MVLSLRRLGQRGDGLGRRDCARAPRTAALPATPIGNVPGIQHIDQAAQGTISMRRRHGASVLIRLASDGLAVSGSGGANGRRLAMPCRSSATTVKGDAFQLQA